MVSNCAGDFGSIVARCRNGFWGWMKLRNIDSGWIYWVCMLVD